MTSVDEPGSHRNTVSGGHDNRIVQARDIHGDVYVVDGGRRPWSKKQRLSVAGALVGALSLTGSGAWYLLGAAPPAPPVLRSGHHVLDRTQGLDMDTGDVTGQDVQGVDISPGGEAVVINAMTHGKPKLATLREPGPIDGRAYAACASVAPDVWGKTTSNLYQMRVGERICVITTDGNLGVLRLTQVPSKVSPKLEFDYTTWQGRYRA